jgi:hypothetical protein
MPSCRDVAEATSGDQLDVMSAWRRIVIRWHLVRCGDCQAYREQILAIGQAAQGLYEHEENEPYSGALDELEASILENLEGGPDRDRPPSDLS